MILYCYLCQFLILYDDCCYLLCNELLRPIILFANIDVSRNSLVVDTSILVKSNMGRRGYYALSSNDHVELCTR
jgi:hypothetical protein